ncbi:MAG: hypothetical protein NT038_04855 [Euryarchaeota archaeon]|nr:hypothetical protein [Euryarchaeota archaeon]
MKTKIVIGCIAAACILLIVPSISAIQYNSAVETNMSQLLNQVRSKDIDHMKQKIIELKSQPSATPLGFMTFIHLIILIILDSLGLMPHYKI